MTSSAPWGLRVPRTGSLEPLLAACLLWNLIDLVATLFEVECGLAVEANPVMSVAIGASPVLFALVKLALVSAGVALLWHYRERAAAVVGALGVFAVYSGVVAYHGYRLSGLALQVPEVLVF